MDITVHTLDARDNVLLAFMQDRFSLSDAAAGRLIVDTLGRTTSALSARGIPYSGLRAALTPSATRAEVALIFDVEMVGSNWYGREVFRALLPLLDRATAHSILHGDIIDSHAEVPSWLMIHLRPSGRVIAPRRGTAFCCIYLNNCSPAGIARFHDGLSNYTPYLGYADMTYGSDFKSYLSETLTHACVQYRTSIIQRHPDDAAEDANENSLGYSFEDFGFTCRSIPEMYFGPLLSYKIERPVLVGDVRDQLISLSTLSDEPVDISQCVLEFDERKFQYLVAQKSESLRRVGVLDAPKATLEDLIRAKMRFHYLYHLRYRPDHHFAGFNLMLELEALETGVPVRVEVGFSYEAERRAIRLVTLI